MGIRVEGVGWVLGRKGVGLGIRDGKGVGWVLGTERG